MIGLACESLAALLYIIRHLHLNLEYVRDEWIIMSMFINYTVNFPTIHDIVQPLHPRQRRTTEQQIWEATLDTFAKVDDIELAYPTTRFYCREHPAKASGGHPPSGASDA